MTPESPNAASALRVADALRALEQSSAGIVVEHVDGRIVAANAAACRMFGSAAEELIGRAFATFCAADERTRHTALRAELVEGRRASGSGRWRFARADGTTFDADAIVARTPGAPPGTPLDDASTPQQLVTILHERTGPGGGERLESLGLLAGGIAHDFNNVLAVMRGNLEFARDALTDGAPDVVGALTDLGEVEKAAERATALVKQLLAFGRLQTRSPEPLDVNTILRELAPLLRLSAGEEIHVALRLAPELPRVYADRTQLEQVLMNLVVNARDAIDEAVATQVTEERAAWRRHTITLTTAVEPVAESAVVRAGVPQPGDYVRLEVRDTGIGMTDEIRARIFEPFFTTKPVDRGTGLGLAATWGIVTQTGGGIRVESEYAAGSAFIIYLPTMPPRVASADDASVGVPNATTSPVDGALASLRVGASAQHGAKRTVLIAEDDHGVRRVTSRILRAAGYRVLEAGDGRSALDIWHAHATEVDVLLADVRMPRLRGDALARIIAASSPGLPVVLMTGYGEEPGNDGARRARDARDESGGDGAPVPRPLLKPFSAADLLEQIAAALGAPVGPLR